MDEEGNTVLHERAFAGEDVRGGEANVFGVTPGEIAEYLRVGAGERGVPIFRRKVGKFDEMNLGEYEKHFGVKYLDHLAFRDGKILQKMLRLTAKKAHTIEEENAWNCALYQKAWENKQMPDVALKWINPHIGYGVFAKNDIPEFTYIGEYTGTVRPRKRVFRDKNNYTFGYVIGPYDTPYVIDAQKAGNFTRFLNHSDTPNLTSRWLITGGVCHIIFYANRLIPIGTQLTYDYGPLYWKNRPIPQDL